VRKPSHYLVFAPVPSRTTVGVSGYTPKDIADERERIQEMLNHYLQFSDESQDKMLGYVHFIEGRLSELPPQIEVGLDPQQIAKILGESLRQHFVQSGVPDTVAGLQATTAAMGNVEKQLSVAPRELTDRDGGVAAKVESANRRWPPGRRCSSGCSPGWKYKGVETQDLRRCLKHRLCHPSHLLFRQHLKNPQSIPPVNAYKDGLQSENSMSINDLLSKMLHGLRHGVLIFVPGKRIVVVPASILSDCRSAHRPFMAYSYER
jgi:hypothetical protein